MNAAALKRYSVDYINNSMKGPLTVSMVLHGLLVIIGMVGLPYIARPTPDLAPPISVDLVPVDEIVQTNKPPARSELQKAPDKPVEKPPEATPPKPAPPQVTSEAPPKPVAPKPPEAVKEAVAPPPEEKPAEPLPKPEPPKAKPKPPEPKPAPTLTQDPPKEQEQDFASLLKNLMPAEETPAAQPSQAPETGAEPSPLAQFSQQITMSELDALRRQLGQCWSLQAGARNAEDLIVDVKLTMNPDRTVRDAEIVDQARYLRDSYFQAAADSALRAVRNPHCNPLLLPQGKYEQWKTITITFDPRQML